MWKLLQTQIKNELYPLIRDAAVGINTPNQVFFQLMTAQLRTLWTEGERGMQREEEGRGHAQGPLKYLYNAVNRGTLPQMLKAGILHHWG